MYATFGWACGISASLFFEWHPSCLVVFLLTHAIIWGGLHVVLVRQLLVSGMGNVRHFSIAGECKSGRHLLRSLLFGQALVSDHNS